MNKSEYIIKTKKRVRMGKEGSIKILQRGERGGGEREKTREGI